MKTLYLIQSLTLVFFIAANASALRLSFLLKREGLWKPVKAFGVTVSNWSYHESIQNFRKQSQLIDPEIRNKINFYRITTGVCFAICFILLICTLNWAPMK
ncbi:MAG: hypothetical protein KDA70_18850 [Planctomycetaceae bacterium]|nr:hypothetical protein [Planctomycetaceae bacterium]MCA9021630.1 hypothetical protein [Planctomycetaceae bacterium]